MSSDWQSYQLGDLFELVNGFAFKGGDFKSSGIPVIKIKNVKPNNLLLSDLVFVDSNVADKRPDKELKRGDILITMSGNRMDGSRDTWVGKVAYFDIAGRYMLNQRVGVLRPKIGVDVDRRCCSYFLSSDYFQEFFIAVATSSGGQANLSPSQILGEKINLPPLVEQKQISSLLTALDDRITLLRETNATLEAIAQALFKSWFVDFDPVRAKMEGRTPEGMDEATAALFPDSFEESELGDIPLGWTLGKLSSVASLKGGKMLEKTSFSEMGANPVFGGAGVMGFSDRSNADGFVITVGRVGAYCGQYFWHHGKAWVNNNATLISPLTPEYAPWLFLWLKSVDMDLIKKGAAQPFVSNGDIADLKLLYPPTYVIEKFVGIVDSIFQKTMQASDQIKSLTILRDTLLPRLISGKLRLPEAEELVSQ